jgi:catechol 2,3-dioxygenase-like lactoylglutathione lyase family enzyme
MPIGKFRCIVMNVTDLERGESFWTQVTGLPLRFSGVGYPTRYSRLGDIASYSILLQLVRKDKPAPTNNAHLDPTSMMLMWPSSKRWHWGPLCSARKALTRLARLSHISNGRHVGPFRKRVLSDQRSG